MYIITLIKKMSLVLYPVQYGMYHLFLHSMCHYIQSLCFSTCVCVWDVFNEMLTRLGSQAHLSDRFPQEPKPSELLKRSCIGCSLQEQCHCAEYIPKQCHAPKSALAGGVAHPTFSESRQGIRQRHSATHY